MANGGIGSGVTATAVAPDRWSNAACAVWSKSGREDESTWLPLVQHLADAARVAGLLWDDWLPHQVRVAIESALPDGARDGRALVSWLAGVHDIGKSSPIFGRQVQHLADHARRVGLHVPASPAASTDARIGRHATLGHWALVRWLEVRHGVGGRAADSYATPVGSHHGQAPTDVDLRALDARPELVGDAAWEGVRIEILDRMAVTTGAAPYLPLWLGQVLPAQAQMLVTGVVVMADWIASDETHFGYTTHITDGRERAIAAWRDLHLPPPWSPSTTAPVLGDRFPHLAGHEPRPVQKVVGEVVADLAGPGLVIVEAPMGEGKTEAALLAAEILAARCGAGGVFVGLPTMATSDAMFSRVRSWVEALPDPGAASVFLAHSKSVLNEEYAGLLRDGRVRGVHDESEVHAVATAVSWLSGRRKGMLASFVVGTVDQVLMAALNAKHVMLRHLALTGKVVVLDEVHAADDYMRVYLCRALEWLASYEVPVVLLSATLPREQLRELTGAYARGLPGGVPTAGEDGDLVEADYPRVSVVDRASLRSTPLPTSRHDVTVDVAFADDDVETLVDLLRSRLDDGGCAAVVRNTVGRAQDAYRALADRYPGEVVLVHSRFLATDRAALEAELRDLLGPGSDRRPSRLVVVGTQVLEQSLDIDFDLMVSDVAPADLLLQRIGRLHRHERDARPGNVSSPALVLTGISAWEEDGPVFDQGVAAVYPTSRLLRSLAAFEATQPTARVSATLPTDIGAIVETAYAADPPVPGAWRERIRVADATLAEQTAASRARAGDFALPVPPRLPEPLGRLLQAQADDRRDDQGVAAVREGLDGIEVIVVQRREGGLFAMDSGTHPGAQVPSDIDAPEWSVARRLATATVRLPPAMCMPWSVDRVLDELESRGYPGWQASPWLRGHLVLTLDADLRANIGGFRLRYDLDLGLVHHREGQR